MAFQEIRYEVEGAVLTVTLDRPDKLNAVTATILEKRPARFAMRPSAGMPPFYPWGIARPFAP